MLFFYNESTFDIIIKERSSPMNDKILKLSELREIDSEVFDKKIDIVRAYLYAGLFGFR